MEHIPNTMRMDVLLPASLWNTLQIDRHLAVYNNNKNSLYDAHTVNKKQLCYYYSLRFKMTDLFLSIDIGCTRL